MKLPQTTFLGLVLLLSGLTLCGFGLWLLLSPPQYQATAKIKIEPDEDSNYPSFNPYFVQTTFEVIRSEFILGNVITNLNLDEIWGKKYNGGKQFETVQTLRKIQLNLHFEAVSNARVIKISFTDDDPDEAAKIANAIAVVFIKYRTPLAGGLTALELETLQRQYDLEEKQIKIMQADVAEMRRNLSIPGDPVQTGPFFPVLSDEQLHQLNQQLLEFMRDYKNSTDQLNELRSYNKQKMDDSLLLEFPDSALTNLFANLKLVKEKLTALTNTESLTNVEALHAQSDFYALNQQIESRVADDINTLTNKLAFQKTALDSIRDQRSTVSRQWNKIPPALQTYYEAMRKLDQLREQHRLLSLKIAAANVDTRLPQNPTAQIIDFAVPPKDPLPRNDPLDISLFGIGLFPSVAGWLLLKSAR